MRNVTKHNITDAFAGYISKDTDPRIAEVMNSLAKHLHAYVNEVQLTQGEWQKGIEMLEWAGDISDKERHEMVILSDLLGVSSLVDLVNTVPDGTSSSVLGPFHISGAPAIPFGHDMKRDYEGPLLLAQGTVKNLRGEPISGGEHRHLANCAKRFVFQSRPGTGQLFLPRHPNCGERRAIRIYHREADKLRSPHRWSRRRIACRDGTACLASLASAFHCQS